MAFRQKKDDERDYSPFDGIAKSAVIQECRAFNDQHIKASKCRTLLTQILFLLGRGETFSESDSTALFFGVTKLFLSNDALLRRMVYMAIKELATSPEEVIIVTSCLTKDVNNSKEDLFRANAIRVLAKIVTDTSMFATIERFMKQSIVDKNPFVASSSLIAGLRLIKSNPEAVRRWVNEVDSAIKEKHDMVQYHALALMYEIKQHDRLAVSKLVYQMIRASPRSPLAQVLLVRLSNKVLAEAMTSGSNMSNTERQCYEYLETSLRNRNEMVVFEAARSLIKLPCAGSREVNAAVVVLQLFLSSPRPVLRFAAVRTLSEVATEYPVVVSQCNSELESLIGDTNRSVATLAITTLLKTGNEANIERLMKQIGGFMSEIADEFKVIVVNAVRVLGLKFRSKHRIVLSFLSSMLREEGGFEFKKSIVDSIIALIYEIPECKEAGMFHLCEYIEDCDFTLLFTQILFVLGKEGPICAAPSKFIRYIYNRVILENATVRASAITTLARFAVRVPELRPKIITLLKRCVYDNDDEVRDRSTMYLTLAHLAEFDSQAALEFESSIEDLKISMVALEKSLSAYITNTAWHGQPFLLSTLPQEDINDSKTDTVGGASGSEPRLDGSSTSTSVNTTGSNANGSSDDSSSESNSAIALYNIPEFAAFGRLFKSNSPVALTEPETEYVVTCIKHIFANHIIFQFNITNTIEGVVLKNVNVTMTEVESSQEMAQIFTISAPVLQCNKQGSAFVVYEHVSGFYPTATFECCINFVMCDVDDDDSGDSGAEDEYNIEGVELKTNDYVLGVNINDFKSAWESMAESFEVREKYSLGFSDLQSAVNAVLDHLGLRPCEGTGKVPDQTQHNMVVAGLFLGNIKILARANLVFDGSNTVVMRMMIRATDADVAAAIAHSIG